MTELIIDTGDTVFHNPTQETWLVAYITDDKEYLCPCGWPECLAKLEDCVLLEKASAEERVKLLYDMKNTRDSRGRKARHILEKEGLL